MVYKIFMYNYMNNVFKVILEILTSKSRKYTYRIYMYKYYIYVINLL